MNALLKLSLLFTALGIVKWDRREFSGYPLLSSTRSWKALQLALSKGHG